MIDSRDAERIPTFDPSEVRQFIRDRLIPLVTRECLDLASLARGVDEQDAMVIINDAALRLRILGALQATKNVQTTPSIPALTSPIRINTEEVLFRLGCEVDYLIDLKHIKALSCVKVARRNKYDVDHVEQFIRMMSNASFRHGINRKLKALRERREAERQKKRAG